MFQEDAERIEHERQLVQEERNRRQGAPTPPLAPDEFPYIDDEPEDHKERRLWREAQTTQLGVLIHKDVTNRRDAQRVRCEVTYRKGGPERAGYYLIYVPEIDPEGLSDEDALAAHPASLATEKLTDWADDQGFDYFSIDDTFPA